MLSNFFFPPENRAVYEIMWEKYSRAGQATDDDMAHAQCMLVNQNYRHTQYVILFHCNNSCKNAPHCYVYTYTAYPVFYCPGVVTLSSEV